MFLGLLFVVGFAAISVTVFVVLVVQPVRGCIPLPPDHPGLARIRRVAIISRLLGLVAGVVAVPALSSPIGLGRGLVLVPTTFATAQILGVLVAEVTTRRDARRVGTASLEVRRVRDYLPRPLVITTLVVGLILSAVIAWSTSVASPDDAGRVGRAMMVYSCSPDCSYGSFGPWPGSFYTAPLAFGLAAMSVLAVATLFLVVRRPRNGAEAVLVVVDDAIRRQAASAVVAAALLGLAGSLTGIALTAGPSLLQYGDQLSQEFSVIGWLLIGLGVLALAAVCWAFAGLLQPLVKPKIISATRLPRSVAVDAEP